jgi:glycosyltransferase involved in cell wall biosynthesis
MPWNILILKKAFSNIQRFTVKFFLQPDLFNKASFMQGKKKIIFLVPYPLGKAPSQRFRVEPFLSQLEKEGFSYSVRPFFGNKTWQVLYKKRAFFLKAWGVFIGFIKRWITVLFKAPFYNFIFIHREAAPLGPPVFEWILACVFKKKIIYDFDDAIWIPNTSAQNKLAGWLKASWKVKYICKWAYKVVGGNDYLCAYASQFNKNVVKIPSCVDTANSHNRVKQQQEGRLTIGWTGSHSSLKYLDPLIPVINELQKEQEFTFIVIADKKPSFSLPNLEFITWNAATEVDDLLKLDIGVMPLAADKWSEGKCGFKLIQYFALGIPAVASPVGVNAIIVEDGVNGFLCEKDEEWKTALGKLLNDPSLRQAMGLAGRKKIEESYSIRSQSEKFVKLFS